MEVLVMENLYENVHSRQRYYGYRSNFAYCSVSTRIEPYQPQQLRAPMPELFREAPVSESAHRSSLSPGAWWQGPRSYCRLSAGLSVASTSWRLPSRSSAPLHRSDFCG